MNQLKKHFPSVFTLLFLSNFLFLSPSYAESLQAAPRPMGSYWAGSGANLSQETYENIPLVERKELIKLLKENKVLFLDIREPAEFEKAHLPNARNISFVNRETLFNDLKIDPKQVIVPYCNWDFRGYVGATDLRKRGIKNVMLMYPHGLKGWAASGFPLAGMEPGKTDQEAIKILQELLKDETSLINRVEQVTKPSEKVEKMNGKIHDVTLHILQKKVEPSHIEASVGDKLRIHLIADDEDHWFVISDFGVNLHLKKGEEKMIELNFTRPGYFPMGCILCCVKYQCRLKQAILVDVKESLASYGE